MKKTRHAIACLFTVIHISLKVNFNKFY